MKTIEIKNVSEKYKIKFIKNGKVAWEEVWALRELDLDIENGKVLGVIGHNGAGKTTLLKLIAGMLVPDKGTVDVKGAVSTIMELGAGFNPEFTGRENISLNGRMYGLSEEKLAGETERIAEFANLGKFIDAPIKYYSQGMYMRLAFALAIFISPDILLIDDILAVGDQEAQEKCIKKILQLKDEKKTIILVSHDMNMVAKLCDRVVLLEKGRVVKDGLAKDVISSYLETVGAKKGIASLEEGDTRAVFNNGRLFISHKDIPITKGAGCTVAFFNETMGNWSPSSSLSWKVESAGAGTIMARGRFNKSDYWQTWTLKLKDNELEWRVVSKKASRSPHADLMLVPDYSNWVAADKEGAFPSYAYKTAWHDMELNDCPEGALGITPALTNDLPDIIINGKDSRSLKLFNTGYDEEGRVIQCDIEKDRPLAIKFFSENKRFKKYTSGLRERFLVEKAWQEQDRRRKEEDQRRLREEKEAREKERFIQQCTISSGPLRLLCDFKNKSIRFFYKERELTTERGLHAPFYARERWFSLVDAEWKVKKLSSGKLRLVLDYDPLPVGMIWDLSCEDNGRLKITVTLLISKPFSITGRELRLELRNLYKDWQTAYEKGGLLIKQYLNSVGPIRLKDNKISRIELGAEESGVPRMLLAVSGPPERKVIAVWKTKDPCGESLHLSSSVVVPKHKAELLPGEYRYFEGEAVLDSGAELKESVAPRNAVTIANRDLSFDFDDGRGRIFWKGRELTTGLGIYTSLSSEGIWHDSYRGIWNVRGHKGGKITATGDWPHLPISQKWQMELINKRALLWKVNMELYENIPLRAEQANIMLLPDYKSWAVPRIMEGKFIDDYSEDYDVSPFRFWYGKTRSIQAVSGDMPKITFSNMQKDEKVCAIVENSDSLFKARMLQYQRMNRRRMPKKRLYFEGVIKIESDI